MFVRFATNEGAMTDQSNTVVVLTVR